MGFEEIRARAALGAPHFLPQDFWGVNETSVVLKNRLSSVSTTTLVRNRAPNDNPEHERSRVLIIMRVQGFDQTTFAGS